MIYHITYRDELTTTVEANNEDEAVYLAEQSRSWHFMNEGHKDLFTVEEEST